ncbi:MAG: hypothetical protein HN390_00660 [Anaerolineae bacterium]|jgi:hypothetical protein|nr:hypothetical protein [Anaerolineae bacterium]MBT7190644.1 hypothetical protein [Anaerolineae bacterium]MBT7990546.1 hypothetical protein [Anaerolineae bacterium]
MITKRQLTILLVLASFLLFACSLFEDEYFSDPYETESYQGDEYAEEEAYEKDVEEAQSEETTELVGSPELSIESIPEYADPAFEVFSQYVDIFGVGVYATSEIPEDKVLHAAGIMAQYLDNTEDGLPDDPAVIRALQTKQASIYIFPLPDSRAEEEFIDGIEHLLDSGKLALQPCYGKEIVPNGAARGEFDASLEEILHLITNTGYAHAYPEIFGEERGTAIADAMDKARGGYFEYVPASYPDGAWYTYDDQTCDYACMISEYHYWALTSLLGGQDFSGRGEEISHEWHLNTPEKLRNGDPAIYALLTDSRYHNPTVLPDGNYSP